MVFFENVRNSLQEFGEGCNILYVVCVTNGIQNITNDVGCITPSPPSPEEIRKEGASARSGTTRLSLFSFHSSRNEAFSTALFW